MIVRVPLSSGWISLTQGLSTLGLKSELRMRLEEALKSERNQYRQWDPSKQEWSS